MQRLKDGTAAAKSILSRYPDYGKAPPEYLAGFSEALAYLDPADLEFMTHPLHGLASRCKFLPTIADVTEMLAERKAKAEQFTIPKSQWKTFEPEAPEEIDYDRRRRVVRECLGYDPNDRGKAVKRERIPPSVEDVRNLKLKTPAAPITPQLATLLRSEGWPFVPNRDQDAA